MGSPRELDGVAVSDEQIERYLMAQFRRVSLAWFAIALVSIPVFSMALWMTSTDTAGLLLWIAVMIGSVVTLFLITIVFQPEVSLLSVGLPTAICGVVWGLLPHLAMPDSSIGQGTMALSFGFALVFAAIAMSIVRVPAFLFVGSFSTVWVIGWIRHASNEWDNTSPAIVLGAVIALASIEILWRMHRRAAVHAISARLESEIDPLTGLLNRRALIAAADRHLTKSEDACLLLIDLDDFKLVSDLFGYDVGDRLLVAAAQRIRDAAPDGALIGRVGGDEIAAFVPSASPHVLNDTCGLIEESFEPIFKIDKQSLRVDVTIGAVVAEPSQRINELLRRADQALLEAKRQSETTMLYSAALNDRLTSEVFMRARLTRAVDAGEFVAHLQPVVDVAANRVAGFEALARWQTTDGTVDANEFLASASSAGLLPAITRSVANDVAQFIEALDANADELLFGINVDLADLGPMLDWIDQSVSDPRRLVVEVTEQDDTDDKLTPELLASKLDSGVQVVLDDFGVAFSSFGRVLDLPIAGLKIDRSFVKDMLSSDSSQAVIRAIASVGDSMELSIVAEGVETEEQSRALAEIGITLQQGYLHSRPLAMQEAREFIAQGSN